MGIPNGRIYWEGPRKVRFLTEDQAYVLQAKLGPSMTKNSSKGIKMNDDNSLVWDHISRRDRGFYR